MIFSILGNLIFACVVIGIPVYGFFRGVKIFRAFTRGSWQGFKFIFRVTPYVIAMVVSVGMLRASGAFELLSDALSPLLTTIGMPSELLPIALIRPFSFSAANAMFFNLVQTHGGNAFISLIAATLMGSTETTFYVLAVYFGSVGITRSRYALPVGLLADLTGVVAALWIGRWMFS